jgi:hypothetical protein
MQLTIAYAPDGQDSQRFEFDAGQLRVAAAEKLENLFGDTLDALEKALMAGSVKAKRVVLWHLLVQQHESLRYDDVDFAAGEVQVLMGREMLTQLREAAAAAAGIDEDKRRAAIAALDLQLRQADDNDAEPTATDGGAPAGKARSARSKTSTA